MYLFSSQKIKNQIVHSEKYQNSMPRKNQQQQQQDQQQDTNNSNSSNHHYEKKQLLQIKFQSSTGLYFIIAPLPFKYLIPPKP